VETIAGINYFLHAAIKFYPNLRRDQIRVLLVHPGPVILPELSESLGRYAQKKLEQRGVEVRLNCKVTGYDGSEADRRRRAVRA
jgi:NADH:ubiquinone reductase (H+-translocating)